MQEQEEEKWIESEHKQSGFWKRIPQSPHCPCPCFMYVFTIASRPAWITFSYRAAGSFSMAATTFCDAACANPSMVSAETASSWISVLAGLANISPFTVSTPEVAILSFKSTMMRWAVFRPMLFTVFNNWSLPELDYSAQFGDADRIIRCCVAADAWDTEISNKKNNSRSCLVENP